APIKRQRVPCPNEDPVYRKYRQDFYGYYPTCWRRFPPGWGCPSPEAPNQKKAFQDLKLQDPPELGPADGDDGRDMDREPAPDRGAAPDKPNLPNVPRSTAPSPFDLDAKPEASPRNPLPA